MWRRFLVLMLVVSVVLLGLPSMASADFAVDESGSQALAHDCACPPGNDVPSDGSASCLPSLGCMIYCGVASVGVPVEIVDPAAPVSKVTAVFPETTGTLSSSSYPPFRPPSR